MKLPSIHMPPGVKVPKLRLPKLKRSNKAGAENRAHNQVNSDDSPVRASPTSENPNPAPYEFSERLKALFADSPRKGPSRTIPTIYPRQRASRFTKFHRGVRKLVGTYMIRLGPKPPYDRPHLRKRAKVAKKFKDIRQKVGKSVERRAHKMSDHIAKKAKKFAMKVTNPSIRDFWLRYIKRDYNTLHGMDYDRFIQYLDAALAELQVARESGDHWRIQRAASALEWQFGIDSGEPYGEMPNYPGPEEVIEEVQPHPAVHAVETEYGTVYFDWELGVQDYHAF